MVGFLKYFSSSTSASADSVNLYPWGWMDAGTTFDFSQSKLPELIWERKAETPKKKKESKWLKKITENRGKGCLRSGNLR